MATRRRNLITDVGLLIEAADYVRRRVTDELQRETGLPGPWFETLLRLRDSDHQPKRMTELAGEVSFPPSSFSRLVDAMEAEDLVERTVDPTNRRATLLCLTDEGQRRVAEAIAAHEPIARSCFADHLTDHERDVLETVTRKLRDANSGHVSKVPGRAR